MSRFTDRWMRSPSSLLEAKHTCWRGRRQLRAVPLEGGGTHGGEAVLPDGETCCCPLELEMEGSRQVTAAVLECTGEREEGVER